MFGQTWQKLEKRFYQHKKSNVRYSKILSAMNKYGNNNFYIKAIAYCENQNLADKTEIWFIKFYNSIKCGYNIRGGGSRGKISPETKLKLSKALTGKKASNETKLKLSVARKGNSNRKGKKANTQTKINLSNGRKGNKNRLGIPHTEDDKIKISKAVNAILDAGGGNSKLNYDLANNIKEDYKIIKSYRKLAKKYNVAKSTIQRVINNEVWIKK